MRRMIAVILTVLLTMAVCLTLTGCDKPKVRVESVLNINDDFKGSRTVTVLFPLSSDIDAVKEDILDDMPAYDVEGVKFSYLGATEDGYAFELKVGFNNRAEYEQRISAVLGRDANAVMARKNSAMFSGTRLSEDFDVKELVEWIERDTKNTDATKDYTFEYPYNKVNIGSQSYDTGTTVHVSEGFGIRVNSVDVKTYNEKASLFGRTFDRSFVFAIPADTYTDNKRKINEFFEDIAGDDAQISDLHEGNSILYTVTFEGLNLSELETMTGAMLDSDGVKIYYGDKGDLSTPLYEGRSMEENLDTLSFYGPGDQPPVLNYTYSLPTNAVRGEGAVYENGSWVRKGTWDDGAYRLKDESGMTRLRIMDGRQYLISGVDFSFESLGDEKFRHTTSFLYPLENGFEGPAYATKYYESKNASAEYERQGENVVCSIVCEGGIDDINAKLEKVFGKGNYVTYQKKFGALSDKTTCVDNIDITEMLSMENLAVPMTYTAVAENGENIVTMLNGGSETAYKGEDSSAQEFRGGKASVGYHGVIPKVGNILIYIIFGLTLVGSTIIAASRLMVPPISRRRSDDRREDGTLPEQSGQPAVIPRDDTPSYAPTQTTTFSIFELGVLSRNKKYAEEIDQDIEKRLHADRLEQRKKEIRQKELEEMERKVYGEKPVEENQPAVEEAPDDDTPRTMEILETFDKASKAAPEPAETADPIDLLDLMNDEDDDDQAGGV